MKDKAIVKEHSAESLWALRQELLRSTRVSKSAWAAVAASASVVCAMGCSGGGYGDMGCCSLACAALVALLVGMLVCVEDYFVKSMARVDLAVKYMVAAERALKADPGIAQRAMSGYPKGFALDLERVALSLEGKAPCKPRLLRFGGSVFC